VTSERVRYRVIGDAARVPGRHGSETAMEKHVRPRWGEGPASITLVRHGESVGNLADGRARAQEADHLDLDVRDADVELSPAGRQQAQALARWLDTPGGRNDRPDAVISSPFRRATSTAEIALARSDVGIVLDERLRERDLGLFDGLTGRGIRAKYPEEAERRTRLGKFYYQPPSGESWCDVVLRVRTFLHDLERGFTGLHLWLISHQAVIMSFRYVLEELREETLLDIDRSTPLPNASMTVYQRVDDGYVLRRFGDPTAVETEDARVTRETDSHQRAGDSRDDGS
jgi:broad specificity phosphatase PhoE